MCFETEVSKIKNLKVLKNVALKNYCGYGVGGKVNYFFIPNSLNALVIVQRICNTYNVPYFMLGNGTNVLFGDKGFNGAVIYTAKLNDIVIKSDILQVECGANINAVIDTCIKNGLGGLEKLAGIPATVGGAITMNASAFGVNISNYLQEVTALINGKEQRLNKKECNFGYRNSIFLKKDITILSASFKLKKESPCDLDNIRKECLSVRGAIQPKGRSCGSVFRNTKTYSAGKLIDNAGLKGLTIGGAQISNKHANFIITKDGATALDVYLLINKVKEKIKQVYDIELKEEILKIGEF